MQAKQHSALKGRLEDAINATYLVMHEQRDQGKTLAASLWEELAKAMVGLHAAELSGDFTIRQPEGWTLAGGRSRDGGEMMQFLRPTAKAERVAESRSPAATQALRFAANQIYKLADDATLFSEHHLASLFLTLAIGFDRNADAPTNEDLLLIVPNFWHASLEKTTDATQQFRLQRAPQVAI